MFLLNDTFQRESSSTFQGFFFFNHTTLVISHKSRLQSRWTAGHQRMFEVLISIIYTTRWWSTPQNRLYLMSPRYPRKRSCYFRGIIFLALCPLNTMNDAISAIRGEPFNSMLYKQRLLWHVTWKLDTQSETHRQMDSNRSRYRNCCRFLKELFAPLNASTIYTLSRSSINRQYYTGKHKVDGNIPKMTKRRKTNVRVC